MSRKIISRVIQNHPILTMSLIGAFLSVIIIGVTAKWSLISSIIMPEYTLGLYNRAFWENFMVEAHGFLLDFIMFGILVFGMDRLRMSREQRSKTIRRQREETERMEEELSDFAALDLPEVNVKKVGHIKRLQRLGVRVFDVTQLTINRCNIKELVFTSGSRLIGLQLQNGHMTEIKFDEVAMRSSFFNNTKIKSCSWTKCDLRNLVLKDCTAKGVKFVECELTNADLRQANLTAAKFNGSSMEGVKFEGAVLNRADLGNVINLDLNALSLAKSIDYIYLDLELLKELKKLKPNMKISESISGQWGIEPQHQQIDCTVDTIVASECN
ncbi:pentapeptide repeat-containing protein [Shewanella psychropiezotolerans]|uniref:pentapeptide repeat-containing protein n=1 Tax=Shewanella psychropiezotolerans TaxID=2593655 RepID=UPI00163D83AE|nr:pentapeptide repeat-containing protein [Shewanella psychropiezotolerans]